MALSVLSDLSENAKEDEIIVEAAVSRQETRTNGNRGIVYRTVCRNIGCGFKFDCRITPDNARLLSAAVALSALQTTRWHNSNPEGASAKTFLPPSSILPPERGWAGRIVTMKWQRTQVVDRTANRLTCFCWIGTKLKEAQDHR